MDKKTCWNLSSESSTIKGTIVYPSRVYPNGCCCLRYMYIQRAIIHKERAFTIHYISGAIHQAALRPEGRIHFRTFRATHHLGTRAAHCCTFDNDSKLGIGPARPPPGELEMVGGRPGLTLTPLADETDMRFVGALL